MGRVHGPVVKTVEQIIEVPEVQYEDLPGEDTIEQVEQQPVCQVLPGTIRQEVVDGPDLEPTYMAAPTPAPVQQPVMMQQPVMTTSYVAPTTAYAAPTTSYVAPTTMAAPTMAGSVSVPAAVGSVSVPAAVAA